MVQPNKFKGDWNKVVQLWNGNSVTIDKFGINSFINKTRLMNIVSKLGNKCPLHYYVVNLEIDVMEEWLKLHPIWETNLSRNELYHIKGLISRRCVEICTDFMLNKID